MTDIIKSIKQKLNDDLIISFDEPIVSLIQVHDTKKKKDDSSVKNYLLATINNDNDSTPIVHLIKVNEKLELKSKGIWRLNQLKAIRLSSEDQLKFEFLLDEKSNKHEWRCDKKDDCDEFLTALWKLAEQFLNDNERPKFLNFEKPEHIGFNSKNMSTVAAHLFATPHHAHENANGVDVDDVAQVPSINLSKKDEDSLLKLMSECDYATTNVEKFIEKLQSELNNLETSNVEGIMKSEENTIKLIAMLDKAIDEIEKIDQRLQVYEDKISAVGDAVRKVGTEDNFIQIQEGNQQNLLDILENMIKQLDLSDDHVRILTDCDLASKTKVERCVNAANLLLKAIDSDVPVGLMKMKAYEEQKKFLDNLKHKFSVSSSTYIKNAISFLINKHYESYKVVDNTLNSLPPHNSIHSHLVIYKDLILWLYKACVIYNEHNTIKNYFEEVKNSYIESTKQSYANEIVPFCACARLTILKQEKVKSNNVGSVENLRNQTQKLFDKGYSDMFALKIDQSTKDILKSCFRKLLKQLSDVVQLEENFCHEFFNIKINENERSLSTSSSKSTASTITSTSTAKPYDQTKNDIAILSEIFKNLIEEQVKQVIEAIQKLEPMTIMFIYSELLYHVLISYNNKHFMHQPLVWLLRVSKDKCDEYTNLIKESIKEYKVNKREKIGVIKYVSYFEEFVKEAEICWDPIKKDMYEKLCIIYQIIVNEIFQGIEAVAMDSQKTPPDVVRFQNYHQMNHIMRSINGLKESTKYAKDQFNMCKQSYIKEHFGRPLEKLHYFFDKVEQRVERGVKYEDISYQMDLSLNNLREIIREYPGKEVKKGLESLYRKVEKHLAENSSLMQVIWRDMSEEFIKQYKNYEKLIRLCYPGQKINLEFTEEEVCQYFQEIALSH